MIGCGLMKKDKLIFVLLGLILGLSVAYAAELINSKEVVLVMEQLI